MFRLCRKKDDRAPKAAWIAEIQVSERTTAKIRSKHALDPDEIVALACSPPPRAGRYVRDERGTRLLVKVQDREQRVVLVVLYPLGDDIWALASAYVVGRRRRA
jgi:hypothetical protein